jgi:secondary thiamine-phosphate synthase enzyme
MVVLSERTVDTKGQGHAVDLTADVQEAVRSADAWSGLATVFVTGSTAGVTTLEFEPGVVHDVDRALAVIAPREADYRHHFRWGDDNGSSHVRAALVGPSLSVPFERGALCLGAWQQIVLLEFDTSARRRTVLIQVMGDAKPNQVRRRPEGDED